MEQKGAGDVAAKRMEEAAWSSAMQKAEGKKVSVLWTAERQVLSF